MSSAQCPVCQVPVAPQDTTCPACNTLLLHESLSPPPPPDRPQIEGYEILGELGRGGMGVVYRARQLELNRLVALKMLAFPAAFAPGLLERFQAEARAVARLQHPNIVQVFEVGLRPVPFLALELVEGGSLDDSLRAGPLLPTDAAALVEKLAVAMDHAHRQGVVHRDLKPGNVLLAAREANGEARKDAPRERGNGTAKTVAYHDATRKPNRALGVPKVADFGLAKHLDDEQRRTRTGAVIGTPAYMAPEQASGKNEQTGPATDIHALGAILYECLTGRPPFLAATTADTLQQVVNVEPVPPKRLNRACPRDLEVVCLKCLHKVPSRRYASSAALADDLQRFREGRPILAVLPSRLERTAKWVRRNPVVSALLVLVAAVTLTGVGLVWWQRQEAITERDNAVEARDEEEKAKTHAQNETRLKEAARLGEAAQKKKAQHERDLALFRLYLARVGQTQKALADNQIRQAREFLSLCPWDLQGWEWGHLNRELEGSERTLYGHLGQVLAVASSPDGKRIASGSSDGSVILWDADTGHLLRRLTGHYKVHAVAFSPDGQRLAAGGDARGTPPRPVNDGGEVRVWNVETGKLLLAFKPQSHLVTSIAFTPDGKQLACGGYDKTIELCSAETGKVERTLKGHTLWVTCLAFAPWKVGGPLLLASGAGDPASGHPEYPSKLPGEIKLWDVSTGTEIRSFKGHTRAVLSLAFRPDGKELATGGIDRDIRLWDPASGAELGKLSGETHDIQALAYSPDGTLLASGSGDLWASDRPGELKTWDVARRREVFTLRGHAADVAAVVFAPGPEARLMSGGKDAVVKLWDSRSPGDARVLRGHTRGFWGVAFSPDGRRLATTSTDRTIKLWEAATGRELATLKGHTRRPENVSFSGDGKTLASAGSDQTIRVWDVDAGKELFTLKVGTYVTAVAFHPDAGKPGKQLLLASVGWDKVVRLWDLQTRKQVGELSGHDEFVHCVAWTPDGQFLLTGSGDKNASMSAGVSGKVAHPGQIKVWDWEKGREVRTFTGHQKAVLALAISPDGKRVLSSAGDTFEPKVPGELKLWDLASGEELQDLTGAHTSFVSSVAFSPDGGRFATASADKKLIVWDARQAAEVLTLTGQTQELIAIAYSPAGRYIASTSPDGTCWLRDSGPPRTTQVLRGNRGSVNALAITPRAVGPRLIASGNSDGSIQLWNGEAGQRENVLRGHKGFVNGLAASPAIKSPHDGGDPAARTGLASAGADGTVRLWDLANAKEAHRFKGHKGHAWCVAYSPDGRRVASGGSDKTVRVWDVDKLAEGPTWECAAEPCSLDYSLDGKWLAAGLRDGNVQLHRASDGTLVKTWKAHDHAVYGIDFGPDSKTLATPGPGGRVRLWDPSDGKLTKEFKGHTGTGICVRFTADGKTLASSATDMRVKLWDVQSGKCLRTFEGHIGPVPCVEFGPEADQLLSGGRDGTVRAWPTPAAEKRP